MKNSDKYKELTNRRYHTYSDYNNNYQFYKNYGKIALMFLVLRELPLKNFYARCGVISFFVVYLWYNNWKYTSRKNRPVYYQNLWDVRELENMPYLKSLIGKRIDPKKVSPVIMECDHWMMKQYPTFYHHHLKHYRYIFRKPRVVQWDGTFNQPVVPYFTCNDRSAFVSNGLLESVEPKPSGNW